VLHYGSLFPPEMARKPSQSLSRSPKTAHDDLADHAIAA